MAGSGDAQLRPDRDPMVAVRNLVVEFPAGGKDVVHAVSDVSFDILEGETLGLVGESGCGKSTTGLAVMQLLRDYEGSVVLEGTDLGDLSNSQVRALRTQFQMIFQDPVASLNPRRKIRKVVAEPLQIWKEVPKNQWANLVAEMLDKVGLDVADSGNKRATEFSGGQAQRVAIARSLILNPRVLVCDEPVASLDVSVQGQILNLLASMQEEYRLTMLFIAHDFAVMKNVSDRLAVMYLGKLCEIGDAGAIYETPAHHYTHALLQSVPRLGGTPDAPPLAGEVPSPIDPPSGCRFRTRCTAATEICTEVEPTMRAVGDDHFVACHHPLLDPVETPVSIGGADL